MYFCSNYQFYLQNMIIVKFICPRKIKCSYEVIHVFIAFGLLCILHSETESAFLFHFLYSVSFKTLVNEKMIIIISFNFYLYLKTPDKKAKFVHVFSNNKQFAVIRFSTLDENSSVNILLCNQVLYLFYQQAFVFQFLFLQAHKRFRYLSTLTSNIITSRSISNTHYIREIEV